MKYLVCYAQLDFNLVEYGGGGLTIFVNLNTKMMEKPRANKIDLYEIAEIRLSYKYAVNPSKLFKVSSAESAYKLLIKCWDLDKIALVEEFKLLLLNNNNRVLGLYNAGSGSASGVAVDLRLIFAAALKSNAKGMILAHNHPSGNLRPSDTDKDLTRRVIAIGKLHEIKVIDHIILSNYGYYSFRDNSGK